MPTPPKKLESQSKHLTLAERSRREAAEMAYRRASSVRIIPPREVLDDPVANDCWKRTRAAARGIDLLDNIDADALATYCLLYSRLQKLRRRYDALSEKYDALTEAGDEPDADENDGEDGDKESKGELSAMLESRMSYLMMRIEATERNMLSYMEKLGLTPASRARLAAKKQQKEPEEENADLYG